MESPASSIDINMFSLSANNTNGKSTLIRKLTSINSPILTSASLNANAAGMHFHSHHAFSMVHPDDEDDESSADQQATPFTNMLNDEDTDNDTDFATAHHHHLQKSSANGRYSNNNKLIVNKFDPDSSENSDNCFLGSGVDVNGSEFIRATDYMFYNNNRISLSSLNTSLNNNNNQTSLDNDVGLGAALNNETTGNYRFFCYKIKFIMR
jgi:hypothetical protein